MNNLIKNSHHLLTNGITTQRMNESNGEKIEFEKKISLFWSHGHLIRRTSAILVRQSKKIYCISQAHKSYNLFE